MKLFQIENKAGKVKLNDIVHKFSADELIEEIGKLFGSKAVDEGMKKHVTVRMGFASFFGRYTDASEKQRRVGCEPVDIKSFADKQSVYIHTHFFL